MKIADTWNKSSYVFVMEYKTKKEAMDDCAGKAPGMRLVSIETQAENHFLQVRAESWSNSVLADVIEDFVRLKK